MRTGRAFICSFSNGSYSAKSPTGGTSLLFEDSDRFGPSKLHPRTADLSEISERLRWFWDWYPRWREAGRPTVGEPMSTPIGPIYTAAQGTEARRAETGTGSVHDGPVRDSECAPSLSAHPLPERQ